MEIMEAYSEIISDLVERKGMTYLQVSEYIKANYSEDRGFSERSIRKFCKENEIRPSGRPPTVSDEELSCAVEKAIEQVTISQRQKLYVITISHLTCEVLVHKKVIPHLNMLTEIWNVFILLYNPFFKRQR